MNDARHGIIEEFQQERYGAAFATTSVGIDFARIAQSFGLRGYTATRHAHIDEVLSETFASKGPVLVDFRTVPMTKRSWVL